MTIPDKDLKILWGKAAGRCSICRGVLVQDAVNPSETTLIGENCHIIAESTNGPRGTSNLEIKDRNRYPNLILLCRNHHKIIDDDTSTYSIEQLHQIKADHELWIHSSFKAKSTPDKDYYVHFINEISTSFRLSNWESISDHLVRFLMPEFFEEATYNLSSKVFKAIWPQKYPDLESEIQNLSNRTITFIDYYSKKARKRDDGWWTEDRSWKNSGRVINFHECSNEEDKWQKTCSALLMDIVHALNKFSEQVRMYIDPNFFLSEGKFAVWDSMGVTNQLTPMRYIPQDYSNITIEPVNIKPIYDKSR